MKLGEVARALSAKLTGDAQRDIRRVVHPLDAEHQTDLAVALSKDAVEAGGGQKAGAVLVGPDWVPVEDGRSVLVYAGNERMAIATLTAMFDRGPARAPGVHPTAVVAADAEIASGVTIGPHTVVGARSRIGKNTTLLPNATIGADVVMGEGCLIHPGVAIGDRIEIGNRVTIHPHATIGADGFSFIPAGAAGGTKVGALPTRIHSLGTVIIGDDVEIGAGTTIDRATLRATRIGRGTKIDNQVQIGHNAVIGEACLICGQVGIAGSSVIGDRVLLAAAVGIGDHIKIGDDATVMAMSGVGTNLQAGGTFLGIPAVDSKVWMERYLQIGRLKRLSQKVAAFIARLEALEKSAKGG